MIQRTHGLNNDPRRAPALGGTNAYRRPAPSFLNRLGISRISLFGQDVSSISMVGREVYQAPNRAEAAQVDDGPSVKSVKIFGQEVKSIKLFGREIFSNS